MPGKKCRETVPICRVGSDTRSLALRGSGRVYSKKQAGPPDEAYRGTTGTEECGGGRDPEC